MTKTYKLPLCWLGNMVTRPALKAEAQGHDGPVTMDDIEIIHRPATIDDIEPGCKCADPRQAFMCPEGHLMECHVGQTCLQAQCSHLSRYIQESE